MPNGRIVRPVDPCVTEVELCKRIQLINRYGSGRLIDSVTSRIIEEDDIPGDYTYIVGLPRNTVTFLRSLRERRFTLLPVGPNFNAASLPWNMIPWFGVLRRPDEVLALHDFAGLLKSANPEWLDGLLAAVNSASPEDALGQMISYVSSSSEEEIIVKSGSRSLHGALGVAWEQKFVDPAGVVDFVYKTLCNDVTLWSYDPTYSAAWTAVVQSSGWGKSRTICQLWTKGVYVIYVSFMSRSQTGFPARTAVADTVNAGNPRVFAAWIMALVGVLSYYIMQESISPEEWLKLQMHKEKEVKKRVEDLFIGLAAEIRGLTPAYVFEDELWRDDKLKGWMSEKCQEYKIIGEIVGGSLKVLICLDEACSFFSEHGKGSFLSSKRAFSCIPSESGIFGILMDTSAMLGRLFPAKGLSRPDPSLKALLPDIQYFQTLWSVGCTHRDWESLLTVMKSQNDICRPSETATAELFKWGRPLWSAALGNGGRVLDVVNFACQKLVGRQHLSNIVSSVTEGMAMALVGVVAGLEVAAWSDLAKDLVANHLRTVSFISEDPVGNKIFSADAMEPILGEAAARVLHNDQGMLQAVLDVAEKVCKQASVIEGSRGQLVGRLFLVLVMHSCCRDYNITGFSLWNMYSRPVPLAEFLSKLCGRSQEHQHDGLICFNRCLVLNRKKITRQHLLMCFMCCVAIIPPKQEAFDLLVPRLMPGPDNKYELRVDRMQGIPIQFRCREKPWSDIGSLQKSAEAFAMFPEETPVQEGEKKMELSGDVSCDNDDDDGDYNKQAVKRIRTEVPGLGIFMHISGKTAGKEPELNRNVLILHNLIKCLFVEDGVLNRLRRLRKAYFKVEDLYGRDLIASQATRETLGNYIKPWDLKTLKKFTGEELHEILKKFGRNDTRARKNALVQILGDCLKVEDADWMAKIQTEFDEISKNE